MFCRSSFETDNVPALYRKQLLLVTTEMFHHPASTGVGMVACILLDMWCAIVDDVFRSILSKTPVFRLGGIPCPLPLLPDLIYDKHSTIALGYQHAKSMHSVNNNFFLKYICVQHAAYVHTGSVERVS